MRKEKNTEKKLTVEAVGSKIFRVRTCDSAGSALNKYGFIKEMKGLEKAAKNFKLENFLPDLNINAEKGELSFAAVPGEDWIGFGDVTRERMYHRGYKISCWVRNVSSYIPVPFFISTKGCAVLVNSTHCVDFDMASSDKKRVSWHDRGGRVDFYLMTGSSFMENISLYTGLCGKPFLPPEWAFGLWYICREQANDYEAVNDALNFRREEIPCDVIGLEPGWMEKKYDLSPDKKWHPERFPIPAWSQKGPHNFIDAIKRMGFHFELWECNEYDLSYEEERRLGKKVNGAEKEKAGDFHKDGEADDHFIWPRYSDTLTKKDEAWFEHHKKFIDQGADFFKQDGTYQMCPHPGRVWGNGMSDDEMHNLYPLLYARQMNEGISGYANKRPVVFTVAGWTGFQSYCGTWTGDVGGRMETLGSMLNTAVMGHNWCTNDMEVIQPEGIHFGYLQPWSQINSWTYFRMPWVQGGKLSEMHRFYSRLRSRLIPYIYSWAYQTSEKGMPLLMRPLQIEFEKDAKCRGIMHEYLLGRDILVGIYKNDVYLPEGRWMDFWTGKIYDGGRTYKIKWPDDRGGNIFIREGAIIPLGPLMQHRGEKELDEIELHIFPSEKESVFELYEDDGFSFNYKDGVFAKTLISCRKKGNTVTVEIAPPAGKHIPPEHKWSFVISLDRKPQRINCKNREWNETRKELAIPVFYGKALEIKI